MLDVSNKTAAICMLARDCKDALSSTIPRINHLRTFFRQSFVIVVENDSIDGTKDMLAEWGKDERVVIISNDTTETSVSAEKKAQNPEHLSNWIQGASLQRIGRMAKYRNIYLDYIRENGLETDFIIVIDADLVGFDEKSIIHAIENAPEDWSALFANGIYFSTLFGKIILRKYYDTYALVPFGKDSVFISYKAQQVQADAFSKIKKHAYVPVISAFGGIAVYHGSVVNARYEARKNLNSMVCEVICEHISVNEYVAKFGGNYVVADMRALYKKCPVNLFMLLSNKLYMWFAMVFKKREFPD